MEILVIADYLPDPEQLGRHCRKQLLSQWPGAEPKPDQLVLAIRHWPHVPLGQGRRLQVNLELHWTDGRQQSAEAQDDHILSAIPELIRSIRGVEHAAA